MTFDLTLDGNTQTVNPNSETQNLADLNGLSMGQHTVILTTKQGGSQSAIWFDKAVVNLGSATYVLIPICSQNES
jgi:hypothetical protein